MIVGSLLILVAAAGLLVTGLMNHNDLFLVGSIAASVIAGIGLYLGARSAGRDEDAEEHAAGDFEDLAGGTGSREERRTLREPAYARRERFDDRAADLDEIGGGDREGRFDRSDRLDRLEQLEREARVESRPETPPPARRVAAPTAAVAESSSGEPEDAELDEDLADEPGPMSITRIDRTRLSGLTVPVQVVDGRPRYHLAGCVHLLGKEDEPLAVNEAVELGFTPCGLCEPTADVLADLSVRSGR
ncbi:hypothetical protein AB0I28_25800 [Phytomonospora sp. NPDC050363]|uniref:hypothetical protein n=1 Tax=Phytomonospora sp. NPDC050363 TaxID=3155642 RepID=UPI0033D98A0C